MRSFRPVQIAMVACLATAAPLHAQSLIELYDAARASDATYQSARAQYDANLARSDQAKAAILPAASLSVGINRNLFDNSNPGYQRAYTSQSATVSAAQPLYRPGNWASYEQGKRLVDLAEAQLQSAEQDLVLRVSQAYFDVLAAADSLTFVRAQKNAVAEQLASAKRNFEVGTSTVTDSREAQARYDLVIAQEIAYENDLRIKKLLLDQLVSRVAAEPRPVLSPISLPSLEAQELGSWVTMAETSHPAVLQAQTALDLARLEITRAKADAKPTVDLTAGYNLSRNPNGTASSTLNSHNRSTSVGVQLTVPLFAGFAIQNRIRETLSLEDKAQADLEATRRAVTQATRTAFFGVMSGLGQIKALEAAEASSQSALEANQLGYRVGVRINIDVLNAQSQLYQTKRDLARARYDVLVGSLRLRQANGSLKPQDLQSVNALLVP